MKIVEYKKTCNDCGSEMIFYSGEFRCLHCEDSLSDPVTIIQDEL